MTDKRVDQIEEDRWKKLEDDFAKWDQNQREVKLQRKNEKLLREAKEDGLAQGIKQGVTKGVSDTIKAFSLTMSVEDIAKALGKSTSEIETILKES